MLLRRRAYYVFLPGMCTLPLCVAQVNILTNRFDNARTAANINENILNVSNVNVNQFGKLYTISVDGAIYAQPPMFRTSRFRMRHTQRPVCRNHER
jgi:hypothetical protein